MHAQSDQVTHFRHRQTYSAPSRYVKAVRAAGITDWEIKTDDLFPYANNPFRSLAIKQPQRVVQKCLLDTVFDSFFVRKCLLETVFDSFLEAKTSMLQLLDRLPDFTSWAQGLRAHPQVFADNGFRIAALLVACFASSSSPFTLPSTAASFFLFSPLILFFLFFLFCFFLPS
jgi:hypothetical protein